MDISPHIKTLYDNLDLWFPQYAAWVLLTCTYFFAYAKDNLSIIDIMWGPGFVVQCVIQLLCTTRWVDMEPLTWRPLLVTGLITLWALRLSFHIASRHNGKDWRYVKLKKRYGSPNSIVNAIKLYLFIYMLQLTIMSICATAPKNTIAFSKSTEVTIYDKIGLGVFIFGFLFEAIADYQLSNFIEYKQKAKKEGKKVERFYQGGLWRYSRHPNYFGEVVVWWGIWCFSLSTPSCCYTNLLTPVITTFLLRYVSGVAFTEKYGWSKDPEFKKHASEISTFIPWFPSLKDKKD